MSAQESALWSALRERGDREARESLMRMHLPYARVVAASYYARRTHDQVEFEDYLQLASVGLVESVDRFDPSRGFQFKTFAARRMHGAILNGLEISTELSQQIAARKRAAAERVDAARKIAEGKRQGKGEGKGDRQEQLFAYLAEVGVGVALGILLEGTGMIESDAAGEEASHTTASPEVSYFRKTEVQRLSQYVRELVKRLSSQEQTVIRYHYLQGVMFDTIAKEMGLSPGRISQIHRGALTKLRELVAQSGNVDISF